MPSNGDLGDELIQMRRTLRRLVAVMTFGVIIGVGAIAGVLGVTLSGADKEAARSFDAGWRKDDGKNTRASQGRPATAQAPAASSSVNPSKPAAAAEPAPSRPETTGAATGAAPAPTTLSSTAAPDAPPASSTQTAAPNQESKQRSNEPDQATTDRSEKPDRASNETSKKPDQATNVRSKKSDQATNDRSKKPDRASNETSKESDQGAIGRSKKSDQATNERSKNPEQASNKSEEANSPPSRQHTRRYVVRTPAMPSKEERAHYSDDFAPDSSDEMIPARRRFERTIIVRRPGERRPQADRSPDYFPGRDSPRGGPDGLFGELFGEHPD